MIVCVCNRVPEKDIQKCVENGCGLDEIKFQTGACTSCQMCKDCIVQMVNEAKNNAGLE